MGYILDDFFCKYIDMKAEKIETGEDLTNVCIFIGKFGKLHIEGEDRYIFYSKMREKFLSTKKKPSGQRIDINFEKNIKFKIRDNNG